MIFFNDLKKLVSTPKDLPGALIPGQVIKKFPLLYDLPKLIGLDLRHLTIDLLQPTEISLFKEMDGTVYSGMAHIHKNYIVFFESGTDINGRPYWVIDIFAKGINIEFMQELCNKLYEVYGSPFISQGAGKYTSRDLIESYDNKSVSLKCWQNLKLEGYALKTCQLWLRMHGRGTIANLHFHIFDQ